MNQPLKNDIHNLTSPLLNPKITPLNETLCLHHLSWATFLKINQLQPPHSFWSTERTPNKSKTKLEPKNWLPISNQKRSAHQTSGPNQRGTPYPRSTRETVANQTRKQLDANSRSRSKLNRPTRIQHIICKTYDMICGGANINQKGTKAQLEYWHTHPRNHPKHHHNLKRKQEVATKNMDPNKRGGLQNESPTTNPAQSTHLPI